MKLLGKPIAETWLAQTRTRVETLLASGQAVPQLLIVQVGERAESTTYVKRKLAAAKKIGINAELLQLPEKSSTQEIVEKIRAASPSATGVIVQLPLPGHVARAEVLEAVPAQKDVDGLSRQSLGALVRNETTFLPATPRAILHLIQSTGRALKGLRVAILGGGLLVGKPLAIGLSNAGATVILIEKDEKQPAALARQADVLVACAGVPNLVTPEFVHKKMLVIDAGFTVRAGQLLGDVSPDMESHCEAVTPVPGGVGPLTVAALLANVG